MPATPNPDLAAALERMGPDARSDLPEGWDAVAIHHQPRKERVTIRIDRDVVGFFRAMGEGWQPRANAVLRSFVLSRGMPKQATDKGGVQDFVAQCRRVREVLRAAEIEPTAELVSALVKAATKPV